VIPREQAREPQGGRAEEPGELMHVVLYDDGRMACWIRPGVLAPDPTMTAAHLHLVLLHAKGLES